MKEKLFILLFSSICFSAYSMQNAIKTALELSSVHQNKSNNQRISFPLIVDVTNEPPKFSPQSQHKKPHSEPSAFLCYVNALKNRSNNTTPSPLDNQPRSQSVSNKQPRSQSEGISVNKSDYIGWGKNAEGFFGDLKEADPDEDSTLPHTF